MVLAKDKLRFKLRRLYGPPCERQQVRGTTSTWGGCGACGDDAFLTFREMLLLVTWEAPSARACGEYFWWAFQSESCPVLILVTNTDGFLQYKEGSWQGSLLDNIRIGCGVSITSQRHPFTSIYFIVFSTVDGLWLPRPALTYKSLLRDSCVTLA